MFQNLIAFQQVYFLTQTVTKVSVLLLYYRVFGVHARFRIAAYITGGIVIAWWISCFFATMFTCIPLKALWDTSIKNKTCIDMRKFGIANGSFNMITDIMVVALSVPMVWSLQLSQKKKILISGAFGMGTLYASSCFSLIIPANLCHAVFVSSLLSASAASPGLTCQIPVMASLASPSGPASSPVVPLSLPAFRPWDHSSFQSSACKIRNTTRIQYPRAVSRTKSV